jgi:hypothetical protein
MITLDEFDVYRYYLALKLHFTTDKYDAIKQKGRVRATREAFNKRRDLFFIRRLAKKLPDSDVVGFLVANFVSGDKWGGVFDSQAEERFKAWQAKIESISYIVENEVSYLQLECEKQQKEFSYIFETEKNKHPMILKEFLGKSISLETLVILNDINPFVDTLDASLYNDIMWNDVSRLIKKYRPFLKYNKKKIQDGLIARLGT